MMCLPFSKSSVNSNAETLRGSGFFLLAQLDLLSRLRPEELWQFVTYGNLLYFSSLF